LAHLDTCLVFKYLDVKRYSIFRTEAAIINKLKSESLTGGSGVHVFLVLWKAASAVQAYAEKSISALEMCGGDFAVLEALLHKGALPVNEIGRKVLLTSGSITAVDRLKQRPLRTLKTAG
jgi:hypothetical protein